MKQIGSGYTFQHFYQFPQLPLVLFVLASGDYSRLTDSWCPIRSRFAIQPFPTVAFLRNNAAN